jgi:hypothetical protein
MLFSVHVFMGKYRFSDYGSGRNVEVKKIRKNQKGGHRSDG